MSIEALALESMEVSDGVMETPETQDKMLTAEQQVDDNGHIYRTPDGSVLPQNTYQLEGCTYETDDYGTVYRKDGEYLPNERFVKDGLRYRTDDVGQLIPEQGVQQEGMMSADTESQNPFGETPEALRDLGEPQWEKHSDTGESLWGYSNTDGSIDWYDRNGVYSFTESNQKASEDSDAGKGTPIAGERGSWSGERGDSTWEPNPDYTPPEKKPQSPYSNPDNLSWGQLLEKYDVEGIEFRDGEPDFSSVAKGEVQIDNFTADRYKKDANFDQATQKLAEQRGCTPKEVKAWMTENNYTWHECSDCKTMQKVPNEIHANVPHRGGVSKAKEVSDGGDA